MTGLVRRTLRGIREHLYLAAVSCGVITAALVLLGVYGLVVANLQAVVHGWQRDVHVSAYFNPDVDAVAQAAAKSELAGRPEVATVVLVTSAEAQAWMAERMPEVQPLVDELGEGALPPSLEITLHNSYIAPEAMDAFAASLEASGHFGEIDYGREWVQRAQSALEMLKVLGGVLGFILGVAALFLVGNTISLVVYARRDELEILRLVGATDSYIVAPFVLEGVAQGVLASALSYTILRAVHQGVLLQLQGAVPFALGQAEVSFLPTQLVVALLLVGVLIGGLAAFGTVRRALGKLA